jgi:hypothetical protein
LSKIDKTLFFLFYPSSSFGFKKRGLASGAVRPWEFPNKARCEDSNDLKPLA